MKNKHKSFQVFFLLALFSFLIQPLLIAQDYMPMAKEGAHWVVAKNYDEGMLIEYLWEYHINGDSTINNLDYKKVYKRDLVPTMEEPPFTPLGGYEFYALIRDDETERKVYAIQYDEWSNCPENEEYLMFDFSLSLGDMINFCTYVGYGNEESISDIAEEERMGVTTIVYTSDVDLQFYEGLGSENGLFEDIFVPFKAAKMPSVPFLYKYCPDNENCNLFVGIVNAPKIPQELHLYPNPAKDFIFFELPQNTKQNILVISDVYGKEIARLHLKGNGSSYKWDCSRVSAGLYFYQTKIDQYQGKFLVEK